MDLIELLGQLDDAGIDVRWEGGRLLFFPTDALPPALLGELRRQKAEAVEHFRLLAQARGLQRVIVPKRQDSTPDDATRAAPAISPCGVTNNMIDKLIIEM